jgi:hypothetical protein
MRRKPVDMTFWFEPKGFYLEPKGFYLEPKSFYLEPNFKNPREGNQRQGPSLSINQS